GRIDSTLTFTPLGIAVLTISDSRDAGTDTSGDLLAERIRTAGHRLAARALVRDSKADIQQQLRRWLEDRDVDVMVSTGGTRLTGCDGTREAVRQLFQKEVLGVADL